MVQRTAQSKLGIQANTTKPEEKQRVSGSLANPKTPNSPHYPDGKTRGADLKVKMKKSGSIKQRPSLDSLKSSPFRREIPQPGKPPTLPPDGVPIKKSLATPQKQPMIRSSSDGIIIPNYMKSTSCSDARKELSPPRRRSSIGSETSSPDTKTPTKAALKRSSSLKVVRTLTKKCSKAVICTDMESRRDTCSSTLKDSKFPQYLTLSPGATEAEGTSAVKVCPYSHCSLNGHRRAPLPPLKCFISARRRSLKMQRSFKAVEDLSPKRQLGNKIEIDVGGEKTCLDDDTDIFVEVYDTKDSLETESDVNEHNKDESGTVASVEENEKNIEAEGEERVEVLDDGGPGTLDNMERDETRSSNSELDGEAEYSVEKEDGSEMKNGEICFNFVTVNLNIHVYTDTNAMKKDEAEARPDEDRLSEVSESSQVSDCLNYDQFSEDEVDQEIETEPTAVTFEEFDGVNVVEAGEAPINGDLQCSDPQEKQDDSDTVGSGGAAEEIMIQETEQSTEEPPSPPLDSNHQERVEEDTINAKPKSSYIRPERSCQELPNPSKITICKNKCRAVAEEEDDDRGFNPRDPNFLPLVADPDSEKVDLRHQMIDERKNSEEWMIDNTLQKVVTKLGSARKRKVALLVEAFEKVRKWENHHHHHLIMSPTTTANHHHLMSPTSIQACS